MPNGQVNRQPLPRLVDMSHAAGGAPFIDNGRVTLGQAYVPGTKSQSAVVAVRDCRRGLSAGLDEVFQPDDGELGVGPSHGSLFVEWAEVC